MWVGSFSIESNFFPESPPHSKVGTLSATFPRLITRPGKSVHHSYVFMPNSNWNWRCLFSIVNHSRDAMTAPKRCSGVVSDVVVMSQDSSGILIMTGAVTPVVVQSHSVALGITFKS